MSNVEGPLMPPPLEVVGIGGILNLLYHYWGEQMTLVIEGRGVSVQLLVAGPI